MESAWRCWFAARYADAEHHRATQCGCKRQRHMVSTSRCGHAARVGHPRAWLDSPKLGYIHIIDYPSRRTTRLSDGDMEPPKLLPSHDHCVVVCNEGSSASLADDTVKNLEDDRLVTFADRKTGIAVKSKGNNPSPVTKDSRPDDAPNSLVSMSCIRGHQ